MAAPQARLTTYRELFATDDLDPLDGDFTAVDRMYRTENNLYDEDVLFERSGNGDPDYPASYVFSRYNGSKYVYEVVHSVHAFPSLMGREVVWEDKTFATLGDVVNRSHVTSVEFPSAAFVIVNSGAAHTVPKDLQSAIDMLNDTVDEEFVGPFANGAPNTKEATTRHYFPLPHRYVNLLLGRSTPQRQGFIDVATVMIQRGDEVRYPNLVNWLLMSITRKATGASSWATAAMPDLPAADTDGTFHKARDKILKRHLPGLQASSPAALAITNQQIADGLQNIAENQERSYQSQLDQRMRESAPKSIEKAFGNLLTKELLVMCNVEATGDLPPLWSDLAAGSKATFRKTLDFHLRNTANRHQQISYQPHGTPDLKDKVINLEWGGGNKEDLALGINPFNVIRRQYVAQTPASEAARQAGLQYDTITSGAAPTLADAKALKSSTIILPNNMMDTKGQLIAMMIVWVTLLGSDHPFVQAYAELLDQFNRNEILILDSFARYQQLEPIYWIFLRFIQIKTHLYWEQARIGGTLPMAPNFSGVVQLIVEENTSWCPQMPIKYRLADPQKNKKSWSPFPATGTIWSGGAASDMSGLTSELTPPGEEEEQGGTKKDKPAGEIETNPQPSTKLTPFRPALKKITINGARNDSAIGPPPTTKHNGQNMELCASYHVRGSCYKNCGRIPIHRPLTTKEESDLLAWCQKVQTKADSS